MKIKALHSYTQDVDTVFGFFHDPDFMKAKYAGVGTRNIDVLECAGSEGRYTVKVRREVPADVPGKVAVCSPRPLAGEGRREKASFRIASQSNNPATDR